MNEILNRPHNRSNFTMDNENKNKNPLLHFYDGADCMQSFYVVKCDLVKLLYNNILFAYKCKTMEVERSTN